jgi:hypothetical protein
MIFLFHFFFLQEGSFLNDSINLNNLRSSKMGFFKCLAYIGTGVGAVILAPVTGGGSLALAIGAMGTTTLAGVAIGAGVGATAAAIAHSGEKEAEAHAKGTAQGTKAGQANAEQKYLDKLSELSERFKSYQNFDSKLVGMYALGLATANADWVICPEEQEELDSLLVGIMAGHLPDEIKKTIAKLAEEPPTLEQALKFAKDANIPKQDIEDIIDLMTQADGQLTFYEKEFIAHWRKMSQSYTIA